MLLSTFLKNLTTFFYCLCRPSILSPQHMPYQVIFQYSIIVPWQPTLPIQLIFRSTLETLVEGFIWPLIVTFGSPENLGFSFIFQDNSFRYTFRIAQLGTFGPFRYTWPTRNHLRPIQVHLDPFRHTQPIRHHFRPTQVTQAHLGTLGSLGSTLGPPRSLRPIQVHLAHQAPPRSLQPTQALLAHQVPLQARLGSLGPIQAHLAH